MVVWIVEEDMSQDVARGVLGVYRTKASAMRAARTELHKGTRYTRHRVLGELRRGLPRDWRPAVAR